MLFRSHPLEVLRELLQRSGVDLGHRLDGVHAVSPLLVRGPGPEVRLLEVRTPENKKPTAGGSGFGISSWNFLEGLLLHLGYSTDPPGPLPPVGRFGRQQQQQQQVAGETMAQAATAPLRSVLEMPL